MLCKWNKSRVYCRAPVFIMSQRSNVAQKIVKFPFDMSKIKKYPKFPETTSIVVTI